MQPGDKRGLMKRVAGNVSVKQTSGLLRKIQIYLDLSVGVDSKKDVRISAVCVGGRVGGW